MAPAPSEEFSLFRIQEDGSRLEYKLRVRLMRPEENFAILADAQAFAKRLKETPTDYGDIYREAQAVELLTRALCHPEVQERTDGTKHYRPLFVTSQQLRESFTENEMAVCLNMYEVTKAKYSPVEQFDADQIDVWAARLSDAALGPFFLSQLDSEAWPELLMSLARVVRQQSEKLGLQLPSLLGTSESDPPNSDPGTGGSTESATVSWNADEQTPIPSEHSLTKQEAAKEVERVKSKARGKQKK